MDPSKKAFEEMRRAARATAALRWSRRELAQVALLKDAHQETIAPLLRDCPVQCLSSADVLLPAGAPCQALYIVLSGGLRMEDPSGTIPDTLIRTGDSIGELSLLQHAIVAWTIAAIEPTRLLVVERDIAWNLIRASHEVAANWLALLAARTRMTGIVAGSEALKTVHSRPATHDESTGLHNRQWLESMLPRQIARSATSNAPLGLLLLEIDGFADYLARHGAAAADRACRVVAAALTNHLRPTDLVASYGIAQFAALLPDSSGANACAVGERVRLAVSRGGAPLTVAGSALALTVSVGVAQLQPAADPPAFLAAAENALQMAQASGGNRVGMA